MDRQLNSTDLFAILAGGKFNHPELGPATWLKGEFSGDDEVNSDDLFLILATGKYNAGPYSSMPFSSQVVPEPSSFALAGLAIVALSAVGWRRRNKMRLTR